MPRVNKVETCIFCDSTPCTCNVKAKAEPKQRKPRKTAAAKPQPVVEASSEAVVVDEKQKAAPVSIQDAMRKAAKKKAWIPEEVREAAADPEMVRAMHAVAPLMAPEELEKWKPVLDTPVEPKARAAAWKERRNVVVE